MYCAYASLEQASYTNVSTHLRTHARAYGPCPRGRTSLHDCPMSAPARAPTPSFCVRSMPTASAEGLRQTSGGKIDLRGYPFFGFKSEPALGVRRWHAPEMLKKKKDAQPPPQVPWTGRIMSAHANVDRQDHEFLLCTRVYTCLCTRLYPCLYTCTTSGPTLMSLGLCTSQIFRKIDKAMWNRFFLKVRAF